MTQQVVRNLWYLQSEEYVGGGSDSSSIASAMRAQLHIDVYLQQPSAV